MTENQEKELFDTLAALVTGVNVIQSKVQFIESDVKEIRETQNEHSRILKTMNAKMTALPKR